MATYNLAYGTETALTIASLNSLGTGAGATSSTRSNTTSPDMQDLLEVTIVTGASGTSSSGKVEVWVSGSTDGTNFADSNNQHLLGVMDCTAVSTTYRAVYNVADAFGGVLPPAYQVRVYNSTGGALAASGNALAYRAVNLVSSA